MGTMAMMAWPSRAVALAISTAPSGQQVGKSCRKCLAPVLVIKGRSTVAQDGTLLSYSGCLPQANELKHVEQPAHT